MLQDCYYCKFLRDKYEHNEIKTEVETEKNDQSNRWI